MTSNTYNVLFLCTGNSARSIMAERIIEDQDPHRFQGFSAGSHPRGLVHPMAIATLSAHGLATHGLCSKSWDEFSVPDAPAMDFVITVCDQAAGEICPIWRGRPVTAHWGILDPAASAPHELGAAFSLAFETLQARIRRLTALAHEDLDLPPRRETLSRLLANDG